MTTNTASQSKFALTDRGVYILVDPDKWTLTQLRATLKSIPPIVKGLIVGGTFFHLDNFRGVMDCCLETQLPVGNLISVGVGDAMLSPDASFVFVPVMLSSPFTQFVTQHLIRAAPLITQYRIPTLSYAYLMLAGSSPTSAEFFTQTISIPRHKPEILATFARVAEYLGLQGVYLESGSGSLTPVTNDEICAVRNATQIPIIVGGGIDSNQTCQRMFASGATCVIIGSAIEQSKDLSWLNKI